MGKVYLIGVGPGDKELLTLKALKIMKEASVVLYDRLISDEILQEVNPDAYLIYVGKENGFHSMEQDSINKIMVDYAKAGQIVARLKSGDPFVFGRVAEEALFLKEHNIDFEIIPGISSAIAAPSHAFIPVTHRDISSSFAIITGHKVNGGLSHIKWDKIIGIDTLIFLMSASSRKDIAFNLIKAGRNQDESVAFIEDCYGEKERIIVTTLYNVIHKDIEINPPVVMVVGEVVNVRAKLESYKEMILCK